MARPCIRTSTAARVAYSAAEFNSAGCTQQQGKSIHVWAGGGWGPTVYCMLVPSHFTCLTQTL
jgi:hypothetical protein